MTKPGRAARMGKDTRQLGSGTYPLHDSSSESSSASKFLLALQSCPPAKSVSAETWVWRLSQNPTGLPNSFPALVSTNSPGNLSSPPPSAAVWALGAVWVRGTVHGADTGKTPGCLQYHGQHHAWNGPISLQQRQSPVPCFLQHPLQGAPVVYL